jgi:hypothetical protein
MSSSRIVKTAILLEIAKAIGHTTQEEHVFEFLQRVMPCQTYERFWEPFRISLQLNALAYTEYCNSQINACFRNLFFLYI